MVIEKMHDVCELMNERFDRIALLTPALRGIVIHDFMMLYYAIGEMSYYKLKYDSEKSLEARNDSRINFETMKQVAERCAKDIDKYTLSNKETTKKVLNFDELEKIDDIREAYRYIDKCLSNDE